MISYIVRIYREEENNPRNFVGTVEETGEGAKRAFTSLDELWDILNPSDREMHPIEAARRRTQSVFSLSRRR